MLYIVLLLVLAALGLLVTALVTGTSLWAWVSIGLSVLAGLLLLVDWLRRRKSADAAESADEDAEGASDAEGSEDSADSEEEKDEAAPAEKDVEQTTLIPAMGELGDPADVPEPEIEKPAAEAEPKTEAKAVRDTPPGVEETAPEDLEVVKDLEDEVVVVDEYPRYHLVDCGWLSGRDTIPIGVGEARQLGFTPCARCGPDAVLAAAHR
ncbi:hypothetical protein CU254_24510 [Amycolatopsis sp. AA4]|uniref:hypothetical protein n=1 Tax=Actinomycetes TaxID=1760 RepID=UPI0001B5708D|nr:MULTISPECIES: hypothetical protein [Actinomycetes]ATY13249.1 hypothetical protein CU254_24510 [Amycolatopsis sp. AA4]EFL09160.1 predicted protein [Streptomyces sp. AA4]